MCYLKRKTYFDNRSDNEYYSPYKINISNWRFMRYGIVFNRGDERKGTGTLIQLADKIIFLPNYNLGHILKIIDGHPRSVTELYFETAFRYSPYYCPECEGAGKFDWISKTAYERRPTGTEARDSFVRSDEILMHPNSNSHIFSRVKLNKGDEVCKKCGGFGIMMDGRFRVFQIKNLKNKLQVIHDKKELYDRVTN